MSCLFFSSFYFIFPSFPFSLLEIRSANSDWREFSRFQAMSWTSKTVSELRSSRSITQLQLGTPPLSGSRYLSYEKRWIYEVHIHERCSFYGLLRTDRGTIWWWRDSWGRERKRQVENNHMAIMVTEETDEVTSIYPEIRRIVRMECLLKYLDGEERAFVYCCR